MEKALGLLDTTLGKKAVMALTGLVLFGFVVAHMAGHLQMFFGPEKYNSYAALLKSSPAVLWGARSVLLASAALHVWAALSLLRVSAAARPVSYRRHQLATSYAARTMKVSGPLLLLFLAFHIAHFTAPGLALGPYEHSHEDVYGNFVNAFRIPWATGLYAVAMLLLGLHLYHGSFSLFRTLGLGHPVYEERVRTLAQAIAFTTTAGFLLVPVAVLLGVIQ